MPEQEETFNKQITLSLEPLNMKTIITKKTLKSTVEMLNKMKLTAEAKFKTILSNADNEVLVLLTENSITCFTQIIEIVKDKDFNKVNIGEVIRICATQRLRTVDAVTYVQEMYEKLIKFGAKEIDIIYLLANTTFPGNLEWSIELGSARDFESFKIIVMKRIEMMKKKAKRNFKTGFKSEFNKKPDLKS